jgi:hypothetical protein
MEVEFNPWHLYLDDDLFATPGSEPRRHSLIYWLRTRSATISQEPFWKEMIRDCLVAKAGDPLMETREACTHVPFYLAPNLAMGK